MNKTGECYFVDEEDFLCLAESFINEEGFVSTVTTRVE
jgi:hypothetical protein